MMNDPLTVIFTVLSIFAALFIIFGYYKGWFSKKENTN